MSDTQTQLRDIQNRQKMLLTKKDQLIREAGIEEQKLKESLTRLRGLGVEDPENLTAQQMQQKATELESVLADKLAAITAEISKGEALLKQYEST